VIGLWKFDGDIVDSSGNGFNAALMAGATYGPGRWGQSLVVNGADYAKAASSGALSALSGTVTMSLWVNPNFPAGVSTSLLSRYTWHYLLN